MTQDRADGAVDVADRELGTHGLALLDRRLAQRHQLGDVEGDLQRVVLLLGAAQVLVGEGRPVRHVQDRAQVQAVGLPVVDRGLHVERGDLADGLVQGPEAELGEVLAHLLGDVLEEVHDVLGLAGVTLAQDRVLRRDAHGAGVEVADPHHDAARDHQRRRGEAVLLGTEQRGDDDVTTGLELAVGLHDDPVAQAVEQQGLLGLGQAELPGTARVLERGQRRGTGAAVVAGDEHHVGVRLGHTRRDRADADLGDQLHVDAGAGVGVLQVVDQLGEILDRVDVVVRRRADQAHARRGVPGLGHPRVDLVAGQLAALAGLGTLGHLDLDVVGVREVLRGHAEAAAGDLLDRAAALGVVETLGVLAALTGVGLAAQPVHGDREGLVRLLADRAVGHRAGREPLDDLGDRLDLLDRDRLATGAAGVLEPEQPAQGHQALGLLVDARGVLLEHVVAPGTGGVLETEDGLGVEQVGLALATPLVLAADGELAVRRADAAARVRRAVPHRDLLGDHVELDAAELGRRAGEVAVHQGLREPDGLEDLRTGVGGHRGDAHLGHHLQHALAQRLDEVLDRDLGVGLDVVALAREVLDGLHREVGVDRRGAVPDQQGHVVDLAHVAGLDEQADLGAGLLAHQVVVHGRGEQQRRDRRQVGGGVPVREHDDARAIGDRGADLGADLVDPRGHRRSPALDVVETARDVGDEAGHVAVTVDVTDLGQVVVGDDREGQHHLPARGRRRLEEVGLGTDGAVERGDELLADRVQRRVRHLGEQLGEVVEDQPRLVRQRRDRGVGAHRADGLRAGVGHRREEDAQLLLGVAEDLLTTRDRGVGVHDVLALGDVVEVHQAGVQPLVVGVLGRELGLDLLVLDDPVLLGVDEEHPARLEAALADHGGRVEVEHTDLGGQDDQAVVGDPVARGAQAVAVEDRADLVAVGEDDAGRPVPRLHEAGVELVEGATGVVHLGVVLPGLRDHHQHRVRQRAAAHVQQLEHLVEGGGVRRTGGADRVEPLEVPGDEVGGQQRLARPHPVAVAHDGVDLTVVGDEAERVGERPAREGVGREARVHDGQRGRDALVDQVGEEVVELVGGEHALVGHGPRGQRREVDVGLALGALAQAEGHPLQLHAGHALRGAGDEELAEGRHDAERGRAEDRGVGGDVAPPEDREALLGGDLLDAGHLRGDLLLVPGQERGADGVGVLRRELDAELGRHLAQEGIRHLHEDAGAVAGVRLRARGTTVLEVAQSGQCLGHDVVAGDAGQGRDEGHATRIVLVAGVVEPLGRRECVLIGHRAFSRRRHAGRISRRHTSV